MTLIVITRRKEMQQFVQEQKSKNKKIGFIPTMGALHQGHASLIKKSSENNDISIVSCFVNPKQFGAKEDLSKYPRQFEKDCEICEAHGAQVLFSPTVEEMYPSQFLTQVSIQKITEVLCGKFRPGHFEGVATVVLLLLNIVQPNRLYLGQKDFQQVQVIKRMCYDLALSTQIEMVQTLREKGGLALSSRNVYLTEDAKLSAILIPQALKEAATLFLSGERSVIKIEDAARKILKLRNLFPQYLEIRPTRDILLQITTQIEEECVFAIAQIIESQEIQVRLIDNIILSEDSKWQEVLKEFIKD